MTELTSERDAALGQVDVTSSLGLDTSRKGLVNYDVCESIYNPGKLALLVLWKEANSAGGWMPEKPIGFQMLRHRRVRIVRDYSMFDRREAPQFFSDAKGHETMRRDRPKPVAIR